MKSITGTGAVYQRFACEREPYFLALSIVKPAVLRSAAIENPFLFSLFVC